MMETTATYSYKFRPGYGSNNLLIEFDRGVDNQTFIHDVFDALKEIHVEIIELEDVWINDEIVYKLNSSLGQFIFTKDSWNVAFIITDNNQYCISRINELLVEDYRFEKIEVDLNNYKLKK